MQAFSKTISSALGNTGQMHFVLPHFQREYRWEKHHWQTLWDDAILTYDALIASRESGRGRQPEHFLGALVIVPQGTQNGTVPVHRLVDGQQRLTTISLLLCALSEAVRESNPTLARKTRRLLLNDDESGDLKLKILPTTKNNDRDVFRAILANKPVPNGKSHALPAYEFFLEQFQSALTARRIEATPFFEVLTSAFQVVWVELDKDEDAHQIFESLNTKGQRLGEVDLVRNYIAMRLPSGEQEKIFFEIWSPIEQILNDEKLVGRSGMGELTSFLRHYDAMQFGILPPENKIYARFRDEMKQLNREQFIEKLHEIKRFAALYEGLLHPDKGTNLQLREVLRRLNALDITVAYPFLLLLSDRHQRGELLVSDYIIAVQTLENYLVRRFLSGEPTSYLNKMFASLGQNVDFSDLSASLSLALSRRNYPSDDKIRQVAPRRDFYDKSGVKEKTVMILERINATLYAGTDVIPVLHGAATLEHVLPQTLSPWWREHLGEDAEQIRQEWQHTLGNLTLVTGGYNSGLSNDPFPEKQTKLKAHGLKLNSEYFTGQLTHWDARAIQTRADELVEQILEIWPSFSEERTAPKTVTAPKPAPKSVVIRGQRFETKSWRDMIRQVAAYVGALQPNFVEIHSQIPAQVRQTPFRFNQYDWGNGWYLDTNHSATNALQLAKKLLQAVGVTEVEWHLEEAAI